MYVFCDWPIVFGILCHGVEFDSSYDFVLRIDSARILGPHSHCKFQFRSFQQYRRVYSDIPTACRELQLIANYPVCGSGLLSRYSDSLWARRFGARIPVGARFSAPVQTRAGAQASSCTVGTGSLTGLKRPWRGVYHPLPSSAEVKERVEL